MTLMDLLNISKMINANSYLEIYSLSVSNDELGASAYAGSLLRRKIR